jgi:hypothetical protein
MSRIGFIVQLFMIAACLVPFTSTRQAGALLALAPTVPIQSAPAPQEDDTERTEQAGREKDRSSRPRLNVRSCSVQILHVLPPAPSQIRLVKALPAPAPLDHFRNGLGSPYRC